MDINTFKPRILEILRQADLDKVSTKSVRQQLQTESNISLNDYKKELKSLIEECYDFVSNEKEQQEASSSSSSEDEAPIVAKKAKTTTTSNKKVTTPKKKATTVKKTATKKEKAPKRPRKPQDPAQKEKNPFTRTWILSPELAAVTGEKALSRPSVVKHLWIYIKANNLQDPAKKTHIFCDEKLQKIFKGETYLSGFTMNKYIGAHLVGPAAVPDENGQLITSTTGVGEPHPQEA
ncbi:SWIB/MDM2 domain-containing protein [Phascolomyces articulosus]|uniref:SWIB/MDM2 domain-containing protein n=1 Tax=Phascolomyces articulosus TaxID=60185 RepID=A0AAD5PB83_9FUNG|nr:SWIB/MDM2 domain-containing protein [Phascolomyces articulosus]